MGSANVSPSKVCFMVMPYGERQVQSQDASSPKKVNFDRLWDCCYRPALTALGYEPIRADMDLGALIIKEMLERIVIAHVVCADITMPNGNVYYEVGVRHAAKERGCVLFSAEWATPLFDVAQMPRLTYPLSDGSLPEQACKAIRQVIERRFGAMVEGTSPVHQSIPDYPKATPQAAESFKGYVEKLAKLQGRASAIRNAAEGQKNQALQLVSEVTVSEEVPSAVLLELMFLLRDVAGWAEVGAYIQSLPESMRKHPVVKEQQALAQSKSGDHLQAIAGLEALILHSGDSSERRGLLGGRYKKLMLGADDPVVRKKYLNQAIKNYDLGMRLDLNDYYPSCNLPRLYRARGKVGDEKLAQSAAAITLAAVLRARRADPTNEWLRPTLLGAAFDDGNVAEARVLAEQVEEEGAVRWKLETTLTDLAIAIELHPDDQLGRELREIYERLAELVETTVG